MRKKTFLPIPRLFILNKSRGPTSADVLRDLKRSIPREMTYKMGHFGTLDPFAEGLLLVGSGGAMRIMDLVHKYSKKTYIATGKFGVKTATGDDTEVSSECEKVECEPFDIEKLEDAAKSFLGEYYQSPHVFSASKFKGRPLYDWARKGVKIEKEKKKRYIFDFKILEYSHPFIKFQVEVSTGTYIRSLFEDYSKKLGTLGHLTRLQRTQIGEVSLRHSKRPEELQTSCVGDFKDTLLKLLPFPEVDIGANETKMLLNGQKLSKLFLDGYYWILDDEKKIRSLAYSSEGILRPEINFS